MPIAALNPMPAVPQSGLLPTEPDKSGPYLQHAPNARATPRPDPAPTAESIPETADTVSLSAAVAAQETRDTAVPVYAEIWKGEIKLAQIDIHGQVTSYSSLLASGGGGLAGPLLAAHRAIQVAQQTGGEIRTAGQVLDSQTLLMRARLASTYTA